MSILRVFWIVQAARKAGRNKADTAAHNSRNNEVVMTLPSCAQL